MSYRLIDANALAMSREEVNDMPCIYADLPNGLDGGYYDMAQDGADESRWRELFGTPERVAWTLFESTSECRCCVIREECGYDLDKCVMYDHDKLLEWLRGDAE